MLPEPKPMTLREAVEAVKIINPHVEVLRSSESGMDMAKRLLNCLYDEHPSQPFRLLALMHHMSLEELAEALGDQGGPGVVIALISGMVANPMPDLMNFGFILGLSKEGWNA